MTISYVGKGTYLQGYGTMFVPPPDGIVANDFLLLRIETKNEDHHHPVGWTKHWLTPFGSGGPGASRIYMFYKWVEGAVDPVHLPDDFTHRICSLIALRGVWKTMPFKRDWVGIDRFTNQEVMKWLEATVDNMGNLEARRSASLVTTILPVPTAFSFLGTTDKANLLLGGSGDSRYRMTRSYTSLCTLHLRSSVFDKSYIGDGGMKIGGTANRSREYIGSGAISISARSEVYFKTGTIRQVGNAPMLKLRDSSIAWGARCFFRRTHAAIGGMVFSGSAYSRRNHTYPAVSSGGMTIGGSAAISVHRTCKLVLRGYAATWKFTAGTQLIGSYIGGGDAVIGGAADYQFASTGFIYTTDNHHVGLRFGMTSADVRVNLPKVVNLRFGGGDRNYSRNHRYSGGGSYSGSGTTTFTRKPRSRAYVGQVLMRMPFNSAECLYNPFVKGRVVGGGTLYMSGSADCSMGQRSGIYMFGEADVSWTRVVFSDALLTLHGGAVYGMVRKADPLNPLYAPKEEQIYTTTGKIEPIIVGA